MNHYRRAPALAQFGGLQIIVLPSVDKLSVYRATFAVGSIDEPRLVTLKARIGEQHLLPLHEFCIGDGAFDRYEHTREIGPYLVRPWHSPIIKWAVADQ